jgi:Secretion system C-terminal sorting domain
MKKIIIGLFLLLLAIPFYGLTQQQLNLKKYWDYRQRLREKFMVVSSNAMEYGVNIPAAEIFYNDPSDPSKNRICWGDENGNMSQYLSVLATELWILKNNGQDYSTTLKELYYAMLALERLDNFSESNLRWYFALNKYDFVEDWKIRMYYDSGDINGFSLRDDVDPSFENKYKETLNVGKFDGFLIRDRNCLFKEENSQDVLEHDMMGLGLISKLVGIESLENITGADIDIHIKLYLEDKGIMTCGTDFYLSPQTINFSLWAKDIVKRYINYMQYNGNDYYPTHWTLVNPVTKEPVQEGAGDDFWLSVKRISRGIIMAGQAITGENLIKCPNEVILSETEFQNMFKYPVIEDDDLTRTVSCVGNVLGNGTDETFSTLRYLRDHYNPHGATSNTVYEHLPLINLAMFDPDYQVMGVESSVYNSDKTVYEVLLNSAPTEGPIRGKDKTILTKDWTSTSRCLWPQHNMDEERHPDQIYPSQEQTLPESFIAFNGLDYMMLHNLYYIAFRKEDIRSLKIAEPDISRRTNSQRAGTIETNSSILGNSVNYTARKQVKLMPGFSASSSGGKTFVATCGSRPNNYDGSAYVPSINSNSSAPTMVHKSYTNTDDQSKIITKDNLSTVDNIEICPNPCRGKFAISVNHSNLSFGCTILNSNGVVVYKNQFTTDHQIIDISTLPKGVYFISLSLNDKTETKKIILI